MKDIAFSHEYVTQVHGFYLIKEEKAMRFDIVVSFDAGDRMAVFNEVMADIKKEFPDYTFQTALDTDFTEI